MKKRVKVLLKEMVAVKTCRSYGNQAEAEKRSISMYSTSSIMKTDEAAIKILHSDGCSEYSSITSAQSPGWSRISNNILSSPSMK
jgi:hypothetical protein